MPVVKVTMKAPVVAAGGNAGSVLSAFQKEAGDAMVSAVQNELGQATLYTLSAPYAVRKPHLPAFKRFAGKDASQPLVLSGGMLEGIESQNTANGVTVTEKADAGIGKDGDDYFQQWEDRTDFFGKAFDNVEPALEPLLMSSLKKEFGW